MVHRAPIRTLDSNRRRAADWLLRLDGDLCCIEVLCCAHSLGSSVVQTHRKGEHVGKAGEQMPRLVVCGVHTISTVLRYTVAKLASGQWEGRDCGRVIQAMV